MDLRMLSLILLVLTGVDLYFLFSSSKVLFDEEKKGGKGKFIISLILLVILLPLTLLTMVFGFGGM